MKKPAASSIVTLAAVPKKRTTKPAPDQPKRCVPGIGASQRPTQSTAGSAAGPPVDSSAPVSVVGFGPSSVADAEAEADAVGPGPAEGSSSLAFDVELAVPPLVSSNGSVSFCAESSPHATAAQDNVAKVTKEAPRNRTPEGYRVYAPAVLHL